VNPREEVLDGSPGGPRSLRPHADRILLRVKRAASAVNQARPVLPRPFGPQDLAAT